MVQIIIPQILSKFTSNNEVIEFSFKCSSELPKLTATYFPELHKMIFTSDNQLKEFVCLYHNKKFQADKNKPFQLEKNDTIEILIALSGG